MTAVLELETTAQVRAYGFRQSPSGDLGITDLLDLAREIRKLAATDISGFVVTQSSDTLEEGAYLLDLTVGVLAPVIGTGAMRNPSLPGADGTAKLRAAVHVASCKRARGLGTLVVFNDEIHTARFVRKTHPTSPAAFQSPTVSPLGWITEGCVRFR